MMPASKMEELIAMFQEDCLPLREVITRAYAYGKAEGFIESLQSVDRLTRVTPGVPAKEREDRKA